MKIWQIKNIIYNIFISVFICCVNMKKILLILYSFLLLLSLLSCGYAKEYLSFETFVQDIDEQYQINKDLSRQYVENLFDDVREHQCVIQYFDSYAYVSPMCFYYKDGLTLSVEDALDYLLVDFDSFFDVYHQNSYNFYYSPTQPYYNDDILNSYIPFLWSVYEKFVITEREKSWKMIIVSNNILAKLSFRQYSFYVVPTYLANRWPCSLQNYRIAIAKLNGLVLQPWEEMILNDLIKNNPNSCKGSSSQSYLFYGWSCGSSTQLFRLSLIMPGLTTIERHNHSKWWSMYYGANVMGDDAAMYQNSQRLVVRNDFDEPIYFRVFEQWDYSYLVGVVPHKIYEYVEIFKETNWLKTEVTKWNFDKYGDILDYNKFDSRYVAISNASV